MKYVIARNVSGRPTLQHAVANYSATITLCGYSIGEWTRIFSDKPMGEMLCKRCREAVKIPIPKPKKLPANVTMINRRNTA